MVHHPPVATNRRPAATYLGLVLCVTIATAARATDFRVHTTVAAEGETQPLSSNLTIFLGQVVYDFPLDSSHEVTVFDSQTGQFTLLDRQRQRKCILAGDELLRVTDAIQQRAKLTRNPRIRFAANPAFQETFDPDTLRLTLAGEHLTYVAIGTRPELPTVAEQYRGFADWFARLNAVRYPRPPAARLQLNEAIYRRKMVPERVSRKVPERQTLSSTHVFAWRLVAEDRQRVEMAQGWSRKYRAVPFDQFRQRSTTPPASASPR